MERRNIEAERWALKMTKTAMRKELGVTLKTYNGYINGATIPSHVLEKSRNLTGKSIDYFLALFFHCFTERHGPENISSVDAN